MRWRSTLSRFLISSASSDRRALDLQSLGREFGSDAFRGNRLFLGDARLLDGFARGNLRPVEGLVARDLESTHALLLRDAGRFDDFAGGDVLLFEGPGPLDFAVAHLLLAGDALGTHRRFLKDACLVGGFAGCDLCGFDHFRPLDFLLADIAFGGDAGGIDCLLVRDPCLLDQFTRSDFGFFHRARPLDFLLANVALGGDARLADGAFVGYPRLLDFLAGLDLRLFGLRVASGSLACHLRALHGAANFDFPLLVEPRRLALALDIERLALGFEVAGADLDHRILFDVVPQFPLFLDLLDDPCETFRIEAVGGVEILQVGLVEIGDGNAFEFESVLVERLGGRLLHALHIDAALLVHLLHRHLGGDRTQRRDEPAGKQRVQLIGLERAPPERGGRDRYRLALRAHAQIELGIDIDAHPVAGDERLVVGAGHRHPQDVHVDRRDIMDDRQHEGAAIDHHLFPKETGADERHLLRGAAIEPVHQIDDDRDDDHRHDEPENEGSDQLPRHVTLLLSADPALPGGA